MPLPEEEEAEPSETVGPSTWLGLPADPNGWYRGQELFGSLAEAMLSAVPVAGQVFGLLRGLAPESEWPEDFDPQALGLDEDVADFLEQAHEEYETPDEAYQAAAQSDPELFSRLPGVGREYLREQLGIEPPRAPSRPREEREYIDLPRHER